MRNMRPRKYFLGISLFGLLLSLFASSSAMSWTASEGLKLRTLSAVSEAARGQVRMELKAAPGEEAGPANNGNLHGILRLFTDEPEGEDDHSERSQKFKNKVSKLTDRECLKRMENLR